jgi:hypothetical protein
VTHRTSLAAEDDQGWDDHLAIRSIVAAGRAGGGYSKNSNLPTSDRKAASKDARKIIRALDRRMRALPVDLAAMWANPELLRRLGIKQTDA